MKTILESCKRREFEVELNFYHQFVGYGQYEIICEVSYNGGSNSIKTYSTASGLIDEIQDAKADGESAEHIQSLYKDFFFDNTMKEIILETLENLNDN